MALGTILDPTALPADDIHSPGPDAGPLDGKTIGFRLDEIWRAWDWIVDAWSEDLQRLGAEVKVWRSHQGRTGAAGEQVAAELDAFLESIDVAVVGLANCGSCTGWTIRDSLAAADKGLPTTAVCTEVFLELAQNLAKRGGRSGLRLHVLPYPLNEKEHDEVVAVAEAHFAGLLQVMGVTTTELKEAHG